MRNRLSLLGLLLWLLMPTAAWSQASVYMCVELTSGIDRCQHVSVANPLPVTGTFAATIGGFQGNGQFANLTATGSTSASTALPTGSSVNISNTGTTAVSCTFATGAATGVTNNLIVQPSSSRSRVVGAFDHIACIDQTGSVSNVVVLEGGSGLGNDSGGGGSSGGGGGAITAASGSYASGALSSGSVASGAIASGAIASGALAVGAGADGWDVSTGITTATAATVGGTGSVNAKLRLMTSQLDAIATAVAAAVPAGTNVIGFTSNDPCAQAAKTNLAISFQTTALTQLIALSGSTKIYVCSLSLIASGATVFSITGGTGSACGTGTAALLGTAAATHGLSLAANGGLTLGSGVGTVVGPTGAGSELCITQTGAGDISGNLTYVQQ